MPDGKPKFDPSQAFEVAEPAGKPKFDPSQPYEPAPDEPAPTQNRGVVESAARGAVRSTMLGSFADEAYGLGGAAAYGLAKGARSVLPGGVPDDAPSVGDVYRQIKGQYNQGDAESQPVPYGAGMAGGLVAQAGPKNIIDMLRSLPKLAENAPAVLRGLLTPEAAKDALKGVVAGTAQGAVTGLGASDADLTRGEFGQAAQDTAGGAIVGGALGGGLGAATGAYRGGLRAKAQEAGDAAGKVKKLQSFEKANSDHDLAVAKIREENRGAKDLQRTLEKAAKEKAAADTAAMQRSAEDAARRPTRDKAVSLLGLEGKQNKFGGPQEARKLAQKLYDEPFPDGSGQSWVEKMNSKSPEDAADFIVKFRKTTGHDLGTIRDELAKIPEAKVGAKALKAKLKGSLERLPAEVERQARNELDAIVNRAASGGDVSAAGLRKVIEDIEDSAGLGTSNLSTILGDKADRMLMRARGAAVGEEKALVAKHLVDKQPQYEKLLDQFGKAKAVELGANEKISRLNRNQQPVRSPKAEKVAKVQPRQVPRAQAKPLPAKPEFPGGPEAHQAAQDVLRVRTHTAAKAIKSIPLVGPIGKRVAEEAAPSLFRSYRPTQAQILKEAETAGKAKESLEPLLRKIHGGGPAAIRAFLQALHSSPDSE